MKQLLLLAALAAIPVVAFSADPPATDQQVAALDPVTVTATRTPVPESDALAATVVIDRAEIERSQATDVAGILQQYAGLEISRSGGPGQPASLFVRGGNSNYTVLLIDGVRIDDATTGAPPLADISSEMIERIEVIEGPRAALYGADALGGVVNIITRQPGPAALDVSLGGGSYDTASAGAALRDQGMVGGHAWGAVFDVQQQHSGGFPTFQGASQSSAYRNRTLNGRGTLALGPVSLEVRAWDTQGNTQYLNTDFPPPNFTFAGFSPAASDFHDQILALEARATPLENWQSSLTFSRSLYQLDQAQVDPGTTQAGFARVIRPELDWHNVLGLDAHNRLSFGARANRERVDALSYGAAYQQVKDSDYGYLQDEATYGRNHGVAAVNYLHDGQFGERFDWNAEYGYDLFAHTRLIASAGTAFRTPTASELYYPNFSNPDLKPEKARNYEVAVRQQITPQQSAQLRLFRTDVRDYVAFFPGPNFSSVPQNVQSVRLEGVQATWRYTDADWDARVDGIWQDPRNRSTDQRLLRRARLIGSAQVDRRFGRFNVGGSVYSSSQRSDVGAISGATVSDGGYALFSINAGVRLTSRLRLDARLDNAFNHHYQTAAGYNQPGSAVYATLRYDMPL